jgi:hypothetical protein
MEDTDVMTQPAWQLSDAIDTLVENGCCGTNCCAPSNPQPQA